MAKRSDRHASGADGAAATGSGTVEPPKTRAPKGGSEPGASKRVRRLESKLADLDRKESKLARRLDRVHERQVSARGRLASLRGDDGAASVPATPAEVAVGASSDATAPDSVEMAYCMREKRRVPIADAQRTVLRNGRSAIAGSCSSCGARLVRLVASPG